MPLDGSVPDAVLQGGPRPAVRPREGWKPAWAETRPAGARCAARQPGPRRGLAHPLPNRRWDAKGSTPSPGRCRRMRHEVCRVLLNRRPRQPGPRLPNTRQRDRSRTPGLAPHRMGVGRRREGGAALEAMEPGERNPARRRRSEAGRPGLGGRRETERASEKRWHWEKLRSGCALAEEVGGIYAPGRSPAVRAGCICGNGALRALWYNW